MSLPFEYDRVAVGEFGGALPTTTSFASGIRSATLCQASARPSTFLYGSSTPTKSAAGRAGGSTVVGSANAVRSV